jgi:uncharacterized protein (DUF433 family)
MQMRSFSCLKEHLVNTNAIKIVDRGRGPQLSSCRITVQDVVPYLQQNYSVQQIREIMPVLTEEEIGVLAEYVREHHDAVMEQDRRIRERNAARKPPPEVEEAERALRLQRLEAARSHIQRSKQEQRR